MPRAHLCRCLCSYHLNYVHTHHVENEPNRLVFLRPRKWHSHAGGHLHERCGRHCPHRLRVHVRLVQVEVGGWAAYTECLRLRRTMTPPPPSCHCSVQNPPKQFAPVAFVILGCLNLFASLLGFWGSYHKKRVLLGFMVCGGISVLLQIALVLALLFSFENVAKSIVDPKKDPKKYDKVTKQLNIARWAALGFIAIEIFTLAMAILLRFVIKEEQPYNAFDEETTQQRSTNLSSLTKEMERTMGKAKSVSEKVRARAPGAMMRPCTAHMHVAVHVAVHACGSACMWQCMHVAVQCACM